MKRFGQGSEDTGAPAELTCNPNNMAISDNQLLENGGEKFHFIHGHQINYWYALPFYESFSQAMCEIEEEVEELSNVWKVLGRGSRNLPALTSERIMKLSDEQKSQIDRKLAGPLIGHSITMEESIIEDYQLLRDFIGFKGNQFNRKESIQEEILTLSSDSVYFQNIESLVELTNMDSNTSFEELAGTFLNAWIDTIQWLQSNKEKAEKKELVKLVGQIQRISSMFSTDLQRGEFLIHGHRHNGHVDYLNCIADSGCWIENKASFIKIDDGKVVCKPWP